MANEDGIIKAEKMQVGDILTFKTAACAINLGASIIESMIGESISRAPNADIVELVAAALNAELAL